MVAYAHLWGPAVLGSGWGGPRREKALLVRSLSSRAFCSHVVARLRPKGDRLSPCAQHIHFCLMQGFLASGKAEACKWRGDVAFSLDHQALQAL